MKAADLREKSVDDLRELQKTLARDVFQNRLKNFTNRLDDTSSMRKTRRDLARVVTLIHEREPRLESKPAVPADAPVANAKPVAKKPAAAKPVAEKPAAPPVEVAPAAAVEAKPEKTAKKKSAKAKQGSEAK
jgi:large subunit ribosomal protein L29